VLRNCFRALLAPLAIFVALSCLGLAIGITRLHRCEWNVFDPIAAFCIGFAVYYGIGNAWFCMDLMDKGHYSSAFLEFDPPVGTLLDHLVEVGILTTCYGMVVAFSMFGPVSRSSTAMAGAIAKRLSVAADLPWCLVTPLAVTNWLQQIGLIPSGATAVPSVLLVMPSVCSLALNAKLAYVAATRSSATWIAVALSVVTVSTAAGASTGMKQSLLMPCVAAFGGLMLGARRPWPIIVAVAVSLPAFFFLLQWNKSLRSLIWSPDVTYSLTERIAALGDAATLVITNDAAESSPVGLGRLCTAVPMMQTMDLVRRGEEISVMDGLVIPHVPRAIWPWKPPVVIGEVLYSRFSGNPGGSSSSPGQPAEAFMYGGWLGVLTIGAAMGTLGAVASAIIAQLWAARRAAALGTLSLITINFGKCENWLWAYLPTVAGCVAILVILQFIAGTLWKPGLARAKGRSRAASK
jgi:hypothetical protein